MFIIVLLMVGLFSVIVTLVTSFLRTFTTDVPCFELSKFDVAITVISRKRIMKV